MLDLNTLPQVPNYTIKLKDGTIRTYDSLLIGFELRVLEGEIEPSRVKEVINKVLELDVDSATAIQILDDFTSFATDHLEESLKNILKREPSSSTTMDSRSQNLKQ